MLWWMLLWTPATACEPVPLNIRTVQPADGDVDVPIDVRIAVSVIGYGTADEYTVELERGAATVETTQESWCYDHEGPYEVHCWWMLKPTTPLSPATPYSVRVRSTDTWQGDGSRTQVSQFVTGEAALGEVSGEPGLEVMEVWEEEAETDCEWDLAFRASLRPTPIDGELDLSLLSLYHLREVFEDGTSGEIIHSVYVTNPGQTEVSDEVMKQYLDGAVPHTGCFSIEQENGAGYRSDAVIACPEGVEVPELDTGGPDTGGGDTGAPASDTAAEEPTSEDTAGTDDPPDEPESSEEAETAPTVKDSGCGGKRAWVWGAVGLFLGLRRRRRRVA